MGRPAKLDSETAIELKRMYFGHPYSVRELAGMFGVSKSTVWRIVSSKAYAGGC